MLTVNDHPHDFREPEPPPRSVLLEGALDVVTVLLMAAAVVALAAWILSE